MYFKNIQTDLYSNYLRVRLFLIGICIFPYCTWLRFLDFPILCFSVMYFTICPDFPHSYLLLDFFLPYSISVSCCHISICLFLHQQPSVLMWCIPGWEIICEIYRMYGPWPVHRCKNVSRYTLKSELPLHVIILCSLRAHACETVRAALWI